MIILDTSFMYSLLNKKEINHDKALRLMNRISRGEFGKPIIFEYVINELVNLAITRQPFEYVRFIIESLQKDINNGKLLLIMLDKDKNEIYNISKLFIKINSGSRNKLSFTDCAILYVMVNNGIKFLATFDSGFSSVLKKVDDGLYELTACSSVEKIMQKGD